MQPDISAVIDKSIAICCCEMTASTTGERAYMDGDWSVLKKVVEVILDCFAL